MKKFAFTVASASFLAWITFMGWHSHNADTPLMLALGIPLTMLAIWLGTCRS